MRTGILTLWLTFLAPSAAAQDRAKTWIFLIDKIDYHGKHTSIVPDQLTARAIQRMHTRGNPAHFDQIVRQDAAVAIRYQTALNDLGINIVHTSRWLNAVTAWLTEEEANRVEALPFVREIRPVAHLSTMEEPFYPPPLGVAPRISQNCPDAAYGDSCNQLDIANAIPPLKRGINGAGVHLGFLDTQYGLGAPFEHRVFDEIRSSGRVGGHRDMTNRDASQPCTQTNRHGQAVASVAAGNHRGMLVGPANGATIWGVVTECAPYERNIEEDNLVVGAEWLTDQGVDIISTSLSYTTFDTGQNSYSVSDLDGDTGITTRVLDWATSRGVVTVASAGNSGSSTSWPYIGTPADGDSVITVGGVSSSGTYWSASSTGPTADGRIKPDVSAQSSGVRIARPQDSYGSSSGTSYSAPMVAGVIAQILQVNNTLTPREVWSIITSTASQAELPDNLLGWGIINADAAIRVAEQTAKAQAILYTSLTGKEASADALCANPADPCRLSTVLSRTDLAAGDTLAIMVSAAGAMVDVTDDVSVGQALDFQLYTNDGSPTDWVAGTLKFSGDLTITAAGVIGSEGDKLTRVIASRQVDITAGTSLNLPGKVTIGDGGRVRIDQTGTANCLLFNGLTIASRTQISTAACGTPTEQVIGIDSSLTVNSELELLGDAILEVTAEKPAKKADQDKKFVEVNSSEGITSSGGMLRLSVMGYDEPNFEAWKDGDVRKDKPCFNVRGSGPIELDLNVTEVQYVCVSVPSIGAGGTSTIEVGTIDFKGATVLDGNLVNEGHARTEFMGSLTITGDLTVDARFDDSVGLTANSFRTPARGTGGITTPEYLATWRASTTSGVGILFYREPPILAVDSTGFGPVTPTKFPDHIATCQPDRRPGIHLNAGAMIEGDVKLYNIFPQLKPNFTAAVEADPDATPPVEAADAMGHYAVACVPGLFLMDKGMTIVEGTFLARETPEGTAERTETKVTSTVVTSTNHLLGGYVYLGGTTTLALEGDVDISDTFTEIVMNKAAGAGTITGCTASLPSSGTAGNKVIFSGSEFQTVTLSSDVGPADDPDDTRDGTLMLGALTIDKSGGSVELVGATDGGITATYLEPLNGALYTANTGTSLLGATSLVFGGGSGMVATNGTGDVYSSSPTSVVYAGGNHTIGDERGSAATVTILSGGTVSMGKGSIGTLNLFAGTFKPTAEVTVDTLNIGNTGMLDLSGGSLKHTGLLHYSGNKARMAGAAWPASDAMPEKAIDMRIIRIQQDCGTLAKPSLHVDLNPGYTAVGGHLEVWRGTLDLNGNTLILESRKDGEQWVSTGNHQDAAAQLGEIINSKAGAAYEDVFERGDELFGALAALDEEYTDEKQAKLDEAIEALRPSGEAKTLAGGGIVVGYLHEDAKKNAKTNLVIWREKQKLPAIKVRGGEVPILGSTHGAKGAQVTIPSLTIEGDKRTHVHIRHDVGRLQVTDSLTMSAEDGKLALNGKENVFGSFKQTEGATTTAAGTADAMNSVVVTGMLTVGDSAKVTFGANGKLMLAGDVMSSGSVNIPATNMTTFNGTKAAQNVSFTDTLGSVTVSSAAGLMLGTDVTQAAMSELTLTRGVVATGDSTWMVLNPNIEADLAVRSSVPAADGGTIKMGSRVSLVEGNVSRVITQGNTGSGNPKGGYLLPIGMKAGEGALRNRYRPLILNFDEDLPATPKLMATASGYSGDMMMWPAEGMTVPSVAGTMQLDTHADIFWKLEMSAIPALAATIRVAADGLTGVNDPKGLRLTQWDCDGTNPRLAGEYDLFSEGMDDASVSANARINGVPNSSIDGVALNECNVFGLAANHAQNPIGEGPPPATPMANVQLIHNIVGATVDVYVDDVLVADNFAFQKATSLSTQIAAGEHMVHVVAATAPDNSTPIASVPVTLAENGMYTVIANGDLSNFKFALLANARSEAVAENKVEFRVVHGAAGLGEVDLRSLTETGRWANNLSFNEATGYRAADATVHNVELLDGHSQIDVFEVDLGDYVNQTVVLALSGAGASSAMGLTLMGVDTQGNVFFPQVVTPAAGEELPTEFALKGNYPNPFNPSTQIRFDLPATAEVMVQVIDLLGRMVLTLPAQSGEAGANRTVELDGASLASGTYLYRLIADMESGVKVETGRMVLIK